MSITAKQVNELRKKTGAGMMDCKKALTEADGDMEKAIELLRKKGTSVAAKRADRLANEGLIVTKISDDKKRGSIVEINCETDFVAKSKEFVELADDIIDVVFRTQPSSVDELLKKNSSIQEKITEALGKIGEKIEISRLVNEEVSNGVIIDYIHMGSKLGVLLKFDNAESSYDELYTLGKDIAMQVAAMNPISVYREEIPKEIIDKEIEIYKEIALKEGKPEQILEKISTGKLNKFYQENCLSEQSFIKDNSKSVNDLIDEFNTNHHTEAKISRFHRFHLGDEKK
ncbi:MAG: translation elongation factor Ts [Ignavibacteria bacterium]|nr:MAG: translation elongation factor Ts [Ignavibacteria bacterium]